MATILIASCSKSDSIDVTQPRGEATPVTISLNAQDMQSRSFLSDFGAVQAWEREINSVTILVYNPEGVLVGDQEFSRDGQSIDEVTITMTDVKAGENYSVYALANFYVPDVYKEDLSDAYTTLKLINNSFDDMVSGNLPDYVCPMVGQSTFTLADHGTMNSASIAMERLQVKAAIATTLELSPEVKGDVRVTNMSTSCPVGAYYILDTERFYGGWSQETFNQTPNYADGEFQNIFYLYEKKGYSFRLTLTCDEDGDFTTTDDQTTEELELRLPTTDYWRNSVMRLKFHIKVTDDIDPVINFTVSDWEGKELVDTDMSVTI